MKFFLGYLRRHLEKEDEYQQQRGVVWKPLLAVEAISKSCWPNICKSEIRHLVPASAYLYIIGECLSRKMITLPNGLKSTSTSTFRLDFMVYHGSRLVFHGSRSVFMVFYSSGSVLMVPGRFLWFQVGFHGFSWFQVDFS